MYSNSEDWYNKNAFFSGSKFWFMANSEISRTKSSKAIEFLSWTVFSTKNIILIGYFQFWISVVPCQILRY